jgi:hypothetical protein
MAPGIRFEEVPFSPVELWPVEKIGKDQDVSEWVELMSDPNPSMVELYWPAQFTFRPESLRVVEHNGDLSTVQIVSWLAHTQEILHYHIPLTRWIDRDLIGLLPCLGTGALLRVRLQLDCFAEAPVRLLLVMKGTACE